MEIKNIHMSFIVVLEKILLFFEKTLIWTNFYFLIFKYLDSFFLILVILMTLDVFTKQKQPK